MPPIPKEVHQKTTSNTSEINTSTKRDDDRVVISGMSGLFPQARSVKEFSDILYNKINPISDTKNRWKFDHPEGIKYLGAIGEGLDLFDAQFFRIHYQLSNAMDPMSRKLLEHAFQALYDAGISPEQLNKKKVGVYIGTSFSESEQIQFCAKNKLGYGLAGSAKTKFANRISFWLNIQGPSVAMDNLSSSGATILEKAYLDIKQGVCEAAIVGSVYFNFVPVASVHYSRILTQSKDGKTRCFDKDANGCVFSEGINVLFLQKAKDALRAYAEIVNVKTEFISIQSEGALLKPGFYRDQVKVAKFLNTFYKETMVSPDEVEYVEAFGSGDAEMEKLELNAIETIFCKNRRDPLLIGSVKSNIGYSDAASDISAIIKVLLGYNKGMIAANLHCASPRMDIQALRDGRMRVVTEHQPFHGTYTAVNSYSIGGINGHVLLHGYHKNKDMNRYKSTIPYLITISGRQESAVQVIFDDLKSRPVDPEEIALFHNIHSSSISGHLGRGFAILSSDTEQKTVVLDEQVIFFDDVRRPLWFVYSGMGSQWPGMGTQFMRIPTFAAAIERCHKALEPEGIDIIDIITSTDKKIFDNILHSFVGIAAIQIGLTDILLECGIVPDNIIGHSVGELGCAYADGCLTAEEMILAAKCRGQISLQTSFIRGSMAAIGLGYQQIKDICPPEIEVACHNSPESCTISGPVDVVNSFVVELKFKGIFAKEVPCSNIPYHSHYIEEAGPGLLRYLSEVIKNPKPRSERWLSTSIPQTNWNEPLSQTCSAEYQTNNLLNPVLFEETSRLIPANAVLVEIAPHGLLQAILKRSLPEKCKNISIARRGHEDNTILLLQALGQLYMEGYNPNLQSLYPKVDFPVSAGTAHLSHLINWAHVEKWFVPKPKSEGQISSAICNFIFTVYDEEYEYLQGNIINGQTLFPFAGALMAVWDTFAMSTNKPKRTNSVRFHDVHLFSQPVLHNRRQLRLNVAIQKGSGKFEVSDDVTKVASGIIYSDSKNIEALPSLKSEIEVYTLDSTDIYEYFLEKDYSYSGEFCSIQHVNESFSKGLLTWNDNWVTLIDGAIQLNALRRDHSSVSHPTYIRDIFINPKNIESDLKNGKLLRVEIDDAMQQTSCGNTIRLDKIQFRDLCPSYYKLEIKPSTSPLFETMRENRIDVQNIKLHMTEVGNINTLHWVMVPFMSDIHNVTVHVRYAGLNYKDARKATGAFRCLRDDDSLSFGMDFSGVTESGERVMGLLESGSASAIVCTKSELLWPVPAHWTLEDAATVPLAYMQAFYCLTVTSNMSCGNRVFVHAGAGALGQAVISIALAKGCEVFTTVSTVAKKQFLMRLFPKLKENNIGNSRVDSFEEMVKNATSGYGCNIVISSVPKELKNATLRCAGLSAITIDVEQLESLENFEYNMFYMTKDRSYIIVDFRNIFDENISKASIIWSRTNRLLESGYHRQWSSAKLPVSQEEIYESILEQIFLIWLAELQILICEGIANGYVRPLSRIAYDSHDASRAFHLLCNNQNRGKVLLHLQDQLPPVQSRLICSPMSSHLIVCDANVSMGIQLANRLIKRGATKIVIHTQYTNLHLRRQLNAWKQRGIEIEILSEHLQNFVDLEGLLLKCMKIDPIEGIYILATDIDNVEELSIVKSLDSVSQKICPKLKYFTFIGSTNENSKEVLIQRAKKSFPTTILNIPPLEEFKKKTYSSFLKPSLARFAVDATEQALIMTYPILEVQPDCLQRNYLLELVTTMSGIVIGTESKYTDTLEKLGLQYTDCLKIHNFLLDHYSVFVERENIPHLTLERLQIIEKTIRNLDPHEPKGLAAFYSYIDSDELLATAEYIPMSTLVRKVSEKDNQFDMNETYLCIIPGFEGHHIKVKEICERLKTPALVVQPGLDKPNETIEESAQRYAQMLLDKGFLKENFYLLGYESGIFEALEIAHILENKGLTGTVFCIGCTPHELQNIIKEHLGEFLSEGLLQDAILKHIFALMNDGDIAPLDEAILGLTEWSEKLDVCVRLLLGRVDHSAQYIRGLITTALARFLRVLHYRFTPHRLRSQVVLLQAAVVRQQMSPSCLQQLSQQPVAEYQSTAPLSLINEDLRCAAIINRYLSPEILDLFHHKNLCETYFLDMDDL